MTDTKAKIVHEERAEYFFEYQIHKVFGNEDIDAPKIYVERNYSNESLPYEMFITPKAWLLDDKPDGWYKKKEHEWAVEGKTKELSYDCVKIVYDAKGIDCVFLTDENSTEYQEVELNETYDLNTTKYNLDTFYSKGCKIIIASGDHVQSGVGVISMLKKDQLVARFYFSVNFSFRKKIAYKLKASKNNVDIVFESSDRPEGVKVSATGYGYTFDFWYIDANGNHSFDEGETKFEQYDNVKNLSSTNNDIVKLSASWEENSYTILFDPFSTLSKDLQSDVTLPADFQDKVTLKFSETYTLKRLEKVGYTYCWFIDTDGDNEIDEGELPFNAEEPVSRLAHDGQITIKAKWTPIAYTIAFYSADKYNMDPMDSISANYDVEYILEEPKAKGYTFVEWKLSEGDVKKAGDTVKNLTTTAGATVTLQASWEENTYTINFNVQDDVTTPEGFVKSVKLNYSEEYTLPTLPKTGYSCYWFVDENGNKVQDSNEAQYNATQTVSKLIESGEITLTPRWTPISYTLKFASSDSRYGMTAISSVTLNYDQEYTLPEATGVGYTFKYWTYNGKEYQKEDLISKLTTENGATVTMTANWTINTYKVTITQDGATITLKANGKKVSNGDYVEYGTSLTVSVTYDNSDGRSFKVYKTDDKNVVVTETNNSTFTMPAYDITASASSSCVATGTLITLADGSQVAVENLTGNEMLLVWNLMTGTFDSAPILFVDSDPTAEYEIINLHFSDGTVVKVIDEHGFYDCDLNEYVFLRSDAQKYVGHHFNKQITDTDGNVAWTTVELTDVVVTKERTEAWSPVTYGHLCLYVNGMLSMPGATTGFINIFEVDSSTLQIDYDKYLADIEEYGLFTYEEFCETFDVSEEIFNAFNGQYLKVSIGKALITYDEIEALIVRYSKFF